jgi:hypothetical protein
MSARARGLALSALLIAAVAIIAGRLLSFIPEDFVLVWPALICVLLLVLPSVWFIILGLASRFDWVMAGLWVTALAGGALLGEGMRLSIGHLAVVSIILLLSAFVSLVTRTPLRRALFRAAEKTAYAKPSSALLSSEIHTVALPAVLVAWSAFLIVGLFFVPTIDLRLLGPPSEWPRDTPWWAVWLFAPGAATVVLVLLAIAVHLRPNHKRALKYALIMVPLPLVTISLEPKSLYAGLTMLMPDVTPARYLMFLMLDLWFLPVVFAVAIAGGLWIRRARARPGLLPGPVSMALLRFCRAGYYGPLLIVCYLIAVPMCLVLLGLRYVVIERFRECPIVYLRSFSDAGSAAAFSKLVAPVVGPVGIVVGLVHARQTASALLEEVSIWQFGSVATVSDERWRNWVSAALKRASVAIVDVSLFTDSVAWELAAANNAIGGKRLLVMSRDTIPPSVMAGNQTMPYSDTPEMAEPSRRALWDWITDASPGYRPWQGRCALAAAVFVSLVALGHFGLRMYVQMMNFQ